MKKNIKESNSQLNEFTYHIDEFNKNKSITKRLISKFPSLYITFSKKNTSIKNSLINLKGYRAIKRNHLFDVEYYLKNNPDVRSSGIDTLIHYLYYGYKEGRNPSCKFDGNYYLKKHMDVKKSNLNPLIHYSLYGIDEGRKVSVDIYQNKKELLYLETLKKNINNEITDQNFCPLCKSHFPAFLPGGVKLRVNAQCPNCGSLERHRLSYLFLQEKTNVFKDNIKMIHFAPERILAEIFLANKNIEYVGADIDSNRPYVTRKIDIQNIDYLNNTFDIIFCSHVLEHVPNDKKALDELFRILKPGGSVLIMVPIQYSSYETIENSNFNTPELRLKYYGQSDHLRFYGLDFGIKLKKAGFKIISDNFGKDMDEKLIKRYGLAREDLFYCTK